MTMGVIKIPCPKCQRPLKLRDPSMLGKRGKCPRCAHKFVLTPPEEDEVEFELAEAAPQPIAVGKAARWVPDDAAPAAPAEVPITPVEFPASPSASPPAASATSDGLPDFAAAAPSTGGLSRLQEIRRKNKKRRNVMLLTTGVAAGLLCGAYFAYDHLRSDTVADDGKPKVDEQWAAHSQSLEDAKEHADDVNPTSGKPITLPYMPAGSRVVIHMHPSMMWGPSRQAAELRACMGPVGTWLEQTIEQVCLYPPNTIDQVTFCLILGGRGVKPEYSALVRMKEPVRKSEWLETASAIRNDDYGMPVYLSDERAYIIDDQLKTFAVGPVSLVNEMVDGARIANPTGTEIQELLKGTDRDRMFTAVFEPSMIRISLEDLVADNVLDAANLVLDWFGDDVDALVWSLHIEDEFFSQFTLRPSTVSSPERLAKSVRKDLDRLPVEMHEAISKMNPGELGKRKLIGRYPAMMQAIRHATLASKDAKGRYVQLTTVLPERAAPNLMIGTLLAWDESTRTDFSATAVASNNTPQTEDLGPISKRLERVIEIDFRRTPLEEAFEYIGSESKIPFVLDGGNLKLAAYTKNMPQTMNLGEVTARTAVMEILNKYDQMCIVIDESKNSALVTTKAAAEAQGLQPSLP